MSRTKKALKKAGEWLAEKVVGGKTPFFIFLMVVFVSLVAFSQRGRAAANIYVSAINQLVFGDAGDSGNVSLQKTASNTLSVISSTGVNRAQFNASTGDFSINGRATGDFSLSGGANGQVVTVKSLTELTTIAASATTTTTIQLPANALILAVSVRVVTTIPTAATFTVTSTSPARTWNTAAVSTAAGSTDPGTLGGVTAQTAAAGVVITPNLTPAAATGSVRVTIHYITVTPPTS